MLINFIRNNVTLGLIEVKKVATADNIADVLTKPLPWSEFAPKAARLLGVDIDEIIRAIVILGSIMRYNLSIFMIQSYLHLTQPEPGPDADRIR